MRPMSIATSDGISIQLEQEATELFDCFLHTYLKVCYTKGQPLDTEQQAGLKGVELNTFHKTKDHNSVRGRELF